jgi:hypothetical protein
MSDGTARIVMLGLELLTSNMMVHTVKLIDVPGLFRTVGIPDGCSQASYPMVESSCQLDYRYALKFGMMFKSNILQSPLGTSRMSPTKRT